MGSLPIESREREQKKPRYRSPRYRGFFLRGDCLHVIRLHGRLSRFMGNRPRPLSQGRFSHLFISCPSNTARDVRRYAPRLIKSQSLGFGSGATIDVAG